MAGPEESPSRLRPLPRVPAHLLPAATSGGRRRSTRARRVGGATRVCPTWTASRRRAQPDSTRSLSLSVGSLLTTYLSKASKWAPESPARASFGPSGAGTTQASCHAARAPLERLDDHSHRGGGERRRRRGTFNPSTCRCASPCTWDPELMHGQVGWAWWHMHQPFVCELTSKSGWQGGRPRRGRPMLCRPPP